MMSRAISKDHNDSRQFIDVYANWNPIESPQLIGQLIYKEERGKGVFCFRYDKAFLNSEHRLKIDPMLQLIPSDRYNDEESINCRVFLDSCPDRWGRLLMKRSAAIEKAKGLRDSSRLTELDVLLGVHDSYRMGAIRFKRHGGKEFLDNNKKLAAPPITSLRQLEIASFHIQEDKDIDSKEYMKWLKMLMAPGSSLGGARPKACVTDTDGSLWLAKFPSRLDEFNVGAWEMLCYELAIAAGIEMSPCRILRLNSEHHTFLTKRFDRNGEHRLHFSSAMTQLGYYDGDAAGDASYLEIAEFLINHGKETQSDLAQLWRRMVFNIAISNSDDHLRNHGFMLCQKGGWKLSPAFDLNADENAKGLHLNITYSSSALDFELAFEVIDFFRLSRAQANSIYDEVLSAVSQWKSVAKRLDIGRDELLLKADAFRV